MTAPKRKKGDGITIRPAESGDVEQLRNFECSRGEWFEDEIQDHIRESLPKQVTGASRGASLVLVATDREDRVIGVAGHYTESVDTPETRSHINRLSVIALSLDQQGRSLTHGGRLSDALLRAILEQGVNVCGIDIFTTIVAAENYRCLRLLERNADWTQTPHGGIKFLRLTARIEIEVSAETALPAGSTGVRAT